MIFYTIACFGAALGPSLPSVRGTQYSSDCCAPRKIAFLTQPIFDVARKAAFLFMVMSLNLNAQLKAPS